MQRVLHLTSRSPYARKVAVVLREKGMDYEARAVPLPDRPEGFWDKHPLGKVPVLDDGPLCLFDSTVIIEYLEDRYPAPTLRGEGWEGRLAARIGEELGDELADAAVSGRLAAVAGDSAALDRALALVERVLARIDRELGTTLHTARFHLGEISVACALSYLSFRHGTGWRTRWPAVAGFEAAHAGRASMVETAPAE